MDASAPEFDLPNPTTAAAAADNERPSSTTALDILIQSLLNDTDGYREPTPRGRQPAASFSRAVADRLTASLVSVTSSSHNYDGLSVEATTTTSAGASMSAALDEGSGSGDAVYGLAASIANSSGGRVVEMLSPAGQTEENNYWALLALVLVVGTAAGNILVCLAITRERRLQNITNYFLMSLAITDLMVAILVMPLGILTLVKGKRNCVACGCGWSSSVLMRKCWMCKITIAISN